MWYYNAEIIKTPKPMVINGLKYEPGLFRDAEKLKELGFKNYSESQYPDSRYYTLGALSIDTSGDEIVGSYAPIGKDVDALKVMMLNLIKSELSSRLTAIDWYWMKALKTKTDVPSEIEEYANALYSEYETKKTEINAMSKLSQIIEYENRPYTQVTKVKHTDEETAKETYGPDTESSGMSINICTHWTSNPNDKVDPSFVSLTAD